MADLTLPEVITRFRGNEARIADFANGNAAGYYITTDGKKVETLPSVVSRLASAIAAASATADTLKGTGGAKLIGFGTGTVDAALTTQAKGIADNAKAITDLDTAKLPKTGGTLTGPLKLSGDPTDPLHAATKGWAEGLVGTYWKPSIGDMLTTVRGAPDATWIPDGANYLQASYPDLFAKLGFWQTDTTAAGAGFTVLNAFYAGENGYNPGFVGAGKDGVLIMAASGYPVSIRRSADGGATFTSTASPLPSLTCLATDGKGLWIGGAANSSNGANSMIRSTDNGVTWQVFAPTAETGSVMTVNTDGKGNWIACTNYAYHYISTNNGATWTKVTDSTRIINAVSAGNGVWFCVNTGSQVGKSTDNGATWTYSAAQSYGSALTMSGIGFANGVMVYIGYMSPTSGTYYIIFGSSVDGVTFRQNLFSTPSTTFPSTLTQGRDGAVLCAAGNIGLLRLGGVGLDPTHASGASNITAIANLSGSGIVSTPSAAVTDGLSTWYVTSATSDRISRALPAYDVKTTFRVPKSLAQPAPFATFVKAK